MCEYFPTSIARAARITAIVGALSLSAACSSEVTRLSQPFFSHPEVTGSVAPIPEQNIAPRAAATRPMPPMPPRQIAGRAPAATTPAPVERRDIPLAAGSGFSVVRAGSGDTIYSLSRRHGVSARAIMAANDMQRPEDLHPGQNILIPPINWRPGDPVTFGAADRPAAEAMRVHVVRPGETLYGIARDNALGASDIARHNRLASADRLTVGQRLEIPSAAPVRTATASNFANDAGEPAPRARPYPETRYETRQSASLEPLPASGRGNRIVPLPTPRPNLRPTRTAELTRPEPKNVGTGTLPEPQAMSVGKFRWPVRGRVISPFGSRPNGAKNDGINVAVPEGTSVKASESGVVAYVGNELKGFGNLILIRHADDWVSAYAHNSQTLVTRGEQVRRGQVIAKAGQSGNVTQPQLHFELRKGSKPVDPLQYLDETG